MKQQFEFTTKQAADYICKRLRIKPTRTIDNADFNVKLQSTLIRIRDLVRKDEIKSKFTNSEVIIDKIPSHNWIDIWVGDTLLTIRCHKTN